MASFLGRMKTATQVTDSQSPRRIPLTLLTDYVLSHQIQSSSDNGGGFGEEELENFSDRYSLPAWEWILNSTKHNNMLIIGAIGSQELVLLAERNVNVMIFESNKVKFPSTRGSTHFKIFKNVKFIATQG
jgi:hypothetical protein